MKKPRKAWMTAKEIAEYTGGNIKAVRSDLIKQGLFGHPELSRIRSGVQEYRMEALREKAVQARHALMWEKNRGKRAIHALKSRSLVSRWLTIREIAETHFPHIPATVAGVRNYLASAGILFDPKACRSHKIKGRMVLQVNASCLQPEAIEKRRNASVRRSRHD